MQQIDSKYSMTNNWREGVSSLADEWNEFVGGLGFLQEKAAETTKHKKGKENNLSPRNRKAGMERICGRKNSIANVHR
jgi:hypothetical protein